MNNLMKEKNAFVEKFSELVTSTGKFKGLRYEAIGNERTGEPYIEYVYIICNNDYEYQVDITGDSMIAIMKDVSREMLKHA